MGAWGIVIEERGCHATSAGAGVVRFALAALGTGSYRAGVKFNVLSLLAVGFSLSAFRASDWIEQRVKRSWRRPRLSMDGSTSGPVGRLYCFGTQKVQELRTQTAMSGVRSPSRSGGDEARGGAGSKRAMATVIPRRTQRKRAT